jgi:hypothetical protein
VSLPYETTACCSVTDNTHVIPNKTELFEGILFLHVDHVDRGRWIFKGDKNPEHHFLRRGSKAVGPMS